MFISRGILRVAGLFVGRHLRIAEESLKIAFGEEKSDAEIREIAKNCLMGFGWCVVEICYYKYYPQRAVEDVRIEGLEHLEAALERGKGVIAVTAHFGNFPLMIYFLSVKGYDVNVILRPVRDGRLEVFLERTRKMMGNVRTIYSIPRKKCVYRTLNTLRENGIVFLLPDQHYGSEGRVMVDYFDKPAATATGPLIFQERTDAAIVPMFIHREKDGRSVIQIEPAVKIVPDDNREVFLTKNTQTITGVIERYVRRHPESWGWMHRRWKHLSAEQAD